MRYSRRWCLVTVVVLLSRHHLTAILSPPSSHCHPHSHKEQLYLQPDQTTWVKPGIESKQQSGGRYVMELLSISVDTFTTCGRSPSYIYTIFQIISKRIYTYHSNIPTNVWQEIRSSPQTFSQPPPTSLPKKYMSSPNKPVPRSCFIASPYGIIYQQDLNGKNQWRGDVRLSRQGY